jgi:hypothetical protein
MTRGIEVVFALILIPMSGFCLWKLSYVNGAIAAAVVMAFFDRSLHSLRTEAVTRRAESGRYRCA